MLELRFYQQKGLHEALRTPQPHRFLFTYETGVGKTAVAIRMACKTKSQRVLVVCPAMVRRTWRREFQKWAPDLSEKVAVIEWGAEAKLASAYAKARAEAYASDIQIISYDLLGQVEAQGWDFVILDEIHHLQNPLSQQSKRASKLLKINPQAHVIGLTATLVPHEIKNIWHPLHLLWPNEFGKPTKSNGISWSFLARYCLREETQYGVRYYGTKAGAPEALAERLKGKMQRVTKADARAYLPRIQAEPFYVSGQAKVVDTAIEWARGHEGKVGIFTHLRSTAEEIATRLAAVIEGVPCLLSHGGHTTAHRDALLQVLGASERCYFVGTYHAFLEGVDLSGLETVLIAEWGTRTADLVQFLGRFARHEAARAHIQYLLREGTSDEVKALAIQEKLEVLEKLFKAGTGENLLKDVFQERELTDDDFFSRMRAHAHSSTGYLQGDPEDD